VALPTACYAAGDGFSPLFGTARRTRRPSRASREADRLAQLTVARVRTLAADVGSPAPMRRAPCPSAMSSSASPAVPAPPVPTRATGPTTASRAPWAGRRSPGSWRPDKRGWCASRLPRARFRRRVDAYWAACEQWADAQLTTTAAGVAEKRAPHDLRDGGRPGGRDPRRAGHAGRRRLRGPGDGAPPAGAAGRGARRRATVQRRSLRPRGLPLPCACGQAARYAGRRAKRVETVLGPLTLERAYYRDQVLEAGPLRKAGS
jgi:hypothetical protein